MRKKMKEIMNKEEGFTLVELLAVIVILGIILAIAVPSVGKVIENSKESAKEAETELVKDAARLYFTTDPTGIKAEDEGTVSIDQLRTGGYLDIKEENIENLKDKSFKKSDVLISTKTEKDDTGGGK